MRGTLLPLLVCLLKLLTSASCDTYSITVHGQESPPHHWAVYDEEVHLGKLSRATFEDDTQFPEDLDFELPFFGQQHRVFVSSNGFLTVVPYAMCTVWCDGVEGFGRYQVRESSAATWPTLGLYVVDLDPTASDNAQIWVKREVQKYVGVDAVTVEYRSVPQYMRNGSLSTSPFTGQIELLTNGTIFMRYKQVIRRFVDKANATTHLFLAPGLSASVSSPTHTRDGTLTFSAIRFEPARSHCADEVNCRSCTGVSGCGWCSDSNVCRPLVSLAAICDSSGTRRNTTECALPNFTRSEDAGQRFYSQHIGGSLLAEPAAESQINNITSPIDLEFSMPIFDFARDGVVLRNISTMGVLPFGGLRPGLGSSGDAFVVFPFVSGALVPSTDPVTISRAPPRTEGQPFCHAPLANSSGVCAQATIVDFGLRTRASGQWPNVSVKVRVLLDATGIIGVRVQPTANGSDPQLTAAVFYPPSLTGFTRYGLTDPGSSFVPPFSRADEDVWLLPLHACNDCRGRGRCSNVTFRCECDLSASGRGCAICNPGYFGDLCAACPICRNNGTCDDGSSGSGRCLCPDPWSGRTCAILCSDDDPRPLSCTACNEAGGECICGRCHCNTAMGWHGSSCALWSDPCNRLSLDGCATCLSSRMPRCSFCGVGEYRCVAVSSQDGVPTANISDRCLFEQIETGAAARCPAFRYQNALRQARGPSLFVIIAVFIGLGFLICIGVLLMWCVRPLPPNPLLSDAARGLPRIAIARREREIGHHAVIGDPTRSVQAIPLRQVSLLDVFHLQQSGAGGKQSR